MPGCAGPRRADEFDVDDVVDGQPKPPHQPSEPTPQCQAGHPGVADGADGTDEAVALGGGVESFEQRTALHGGDSAVGIDGHLLHLAEIDHHAVVTGREARVAVATAADGDDEIPVSGELERGCHIGGRGAAGDEGRTPVGGCIPYPPRLFVARDAGDDQTAGEALAESLRARPLCS